jgi:Rod binding domain-containing protein
MFSPISPDSQPATQSQSATQSKDDPAKIQDAARQFEALLISQMMQSMRNSEGGWMGTDADDAASSAMEYGQEIFAQALATGGGLGLAKLVVDGLKR